MSDQVSTATATCGHTQPAAHVAILQQAVGVLMGRYEFPPETANALLRSWANQCDADPCRVAEAFVYGICLGRATTCPGTLLRQLEQLLRHLPAPSEY